MLIILQKKRTTIKELLPNTFHISIVHGPSFKSYKCNYLTAGPCTALEQAALKSPSVQSPFALTYYSP